MSTLNDLESFQGRVVIVQIDLPNAGPDDDTYEEVTGRVIAAGKDTGLVLQTKAGARLIAIVDILDIERAPSDGKIMRRHVEPQTIDTVRQHLVDRHGLLVVLARNLTPAAALDLHSEMNHEPIGHRHDTRPPRTSRQKPQAE